MSRRALILFALMSVIWGIPYLFIRIAVAEITPATLVLGRTVIAAVVLLPIALVRTDLRQVLADADDPCVITNVRKNDASVIAGLVFAAGDPSSFGANHLA
jgi:drug/metabolite transporter (DMT)-like permease